jgi:hypothetical protein
MQPVGWLKNENPAFRFADKPGFHKVTFLPAACKCLRNIEATILPDSVALYPGYAGCPGLPIR